MELTDFYFFIVPLVLLLLLLIPVILYYARKEEHSSNEVRRLTKEREQHPQIKQGPEAIMFLEEFIQGMERSDAGTMTEPQARVMIRVAEVLLSTISKERTLLDRLKHTELISKLKDTVEKLIQQVSRDLETDVDERIADQEAEVLDKLKNLKIL
ncbi:MAG: hypothetical protein AM326_05400 [Candidatus Thorarchaeota archaeon SMTZ-45]|jgi:hypothetical protein|nr:MAG: hypothetical protein AM326_05400 [Candidatus Thorarchaeota archaeon SMTZ-45]